jgi:hypothetical protein
MVLSGGLGSSAYVRQRLEQQFMSFPHPNASRVAVIPCNEPQLVVVRGLLLDQQQRWETGGTRSVLAQRIARASYGVIVQEAYVPAKHFDEDLADDRFSPGQKFAINQIQWLIRKGDAVSPGAPLVKSFEIRLADGEVTRRWASKIVVSQNDPGFLPTSMKRGECQQQLIHCRCSSADVDAQLGPRSYATSTVTSRACSRSSWSRSTREGHASAPAISFMCANLT